MMSDSVPLSTVKRASWCVAALVGLLTLCVTRFANAEIIPALESDPKQWVWDMGIPYFDAYGQIRTRTGIEEPFGLDFNGLATKWCTTIATKWETQADYERELGRTAPDAYSCNQGPSDQNSPVPALGKICKFGCLTRPGYVYNLWITDVPGWSQLRGTYSCPANQNWTLVYASCQRPDCVFGQYRDSADGICKSLQDDKRRGDTPCELSSGNPINSGTGEKHQVVDVYGDLLRLHYSSSRVAVEPVFRGIFAPGWTTVFDTRVHSADDNGSAVGPSIATVRKPRGQLIDFRRQLDGTYRADADVRDRIVRLTTSSGTTAGWQLFDSDGARIYLFESLPNLWSARLTQFVDITGSSHVVNYRADGLLNAASNPDTGKALVFNYTTAPQVGFVTLPGGSSISFGYDADLIRLSSISWPHAPSGSETMSFKYDDARFAYNLTGVVDENSVRYATWSYDAQGRAASSEHAGGVERSVLGYYDNATVVTDALGTSRVRYLSKIQGVTRGVSETQPAGAGCAASMSKQTLDANGNLTSRDDFNGNRICLLPDSSRNLSVTTVEGLATSAVCSTVVAAGALLPSGSRKISTEWHPSWQLKTRVAEPLRLTTYVYNGQPDPFNGGALASCAPSGAVLPGGSSIVVLCKRVVQATTDANGGLGFGAPLVTGAAARQETWTYDRIGQVLSYRGPRTDVNETTTFTYYTANTTEFSIGDLATVTNAAGQVTRYTNYDSHGQVLRSVDPAGIVTVNTYDLRRRPTSTTVGGLQTSWAYDLAGLLQTVTLPDGTRISYGYDSAHRVKSVTDAAGNSIVYTLDNASNRIKEEIKDSTGALQRSIGRSFDQLGRLERVTGAPQ